MSKLFTVSWLEFKSAIASGVLMALIVVCANIISVGDVSQVNWNMLANAGIIAFLTSFVSFLKSLLTTNSGTLAGVVKIK